MRFVYLFVMIGLMFSACGQKAQEQKGSDVVAKIGDKSITAEELNKTALKELTALELEKYKIKKNVLNMMVNQMLVESAAKKANLTVNDYLKKEVFDKISEVTNKEAKEFYNSMKTKDSQPFAAISEQVKSYLKRGKQVNLQNELIAKLKSEQNVKIMLDVPRTDISVSDDLPSLGNKSAKVQIIEFSDYQCPFCKRTRPAVLKIIEEYGDKVNYVFMDFPLPIHPSAKLAHIAARCAGDQGKYYEYNRKIFDNQSKIGEKALKKYAKELNLSMDDFNKCLKDEKYAKLVEKHIEKGTQAGVNGTPAFFINGIMISGAQPYSAFKETIDAELER